VEVTDNHFSRHFLHVEKEFSPKQNFKNFFLRCSSFPKIFFPEFLLKKNTLLMNNFYKAYNLSFLRK